MIFGGVFFGVFLENITSRRVFHNCDNLLNSYFFQNNNCIIKVHPLKKINLTNLPPRICTFCTFFSFLFLFFSLINYVSNYHNHYHNHNHNHYHVAFACLCLHMLAYAYFNIMLVLSILSVYIFSEGAVIVPLLYLP